MFSTIQASHHTKLLYLWAKKANNYTVGNIRPIVLLEVTKELWFKVISRKVQSAVEDAGVLQPNQYGFRNQRSTTDPLIQVINTLEVTAEQSLYVTHKLCFLR